ncbi:MAG: HAD family hydrolase [Candidatus Binatia bacterium]
MKKEIELIMFDLDGTLADTGQDLTRALNHVRARFNLEPLQDRLIHGYVGRGSEFLLRSFLPEKIQLRFEEALRLFLDHYEEHLLDTTVLYPSVEETLRYFREKKKAVVTNKYHRFTLPVLKGLGIDGWFDAILGGDNVPRKKPDPAPLHQVLHRFGVSPTRAVMVGDSETDMEAGKRAGVHTCGVSYGLGRREEMMKSEPDFFIDDLHQLTEYFW